MIGNKSTKVLLVSAYYITLIILSSLVCYSHNFVFFNRQQQSKPISLTEQQSSEVTLQQTELNNNFDFNDDQLIDDSSMESRRFERSVESGSNCITYSMVPSLNRIVCLSPSKSDDKKRDYAQQKQNGGPIRKNPIIDEEKYSGLIPMDVVSNKKRTAPTVENILNTIEDTLRRDREFSNWIVEEQAARLGSLTRKLASNSKISTSSSSDNLSDRRKELKIHQLHKDRDDLFVNLNKKIKPMIRSYLPSKSSDQEEKVAQTIRTQRTGLTSVSNSTEIESIAPSSFEYKVMKPLEENWRNSNNTILYHLSSSILSGGKKDGERIDEDGARLAGGHSGRLVNQQQQLGCHKRQFRFKAVRSDKFGNKCTGWVTTSICYGSCDTGEFSDHIFPYKKSVHKVCTHGKRIKKKVILDECSSASIEQTLREYNYIDAGSCVCKSCNSIDTTCLGSLSNPELQESSIKEDIGIEENFFF